MMRGVDAASPLCEVVRRLQPTHFRERRARTTSVRGARPQRRIAASWCAAPTPPLGARAARNLFIRGGMTPTSMLTHDTLRWNIHAACPAEWRQYIAQCGGGYFHSSRGLLASAPAGEPVFLELWDGGSLAGIATGVRHGGLNGAGRRHIYFPTLPAFVTRKLSEAALAALVTRLRRDGIAEVVLDSFDAQMVPGALLNAAELRRRREYAIDVDGSPDYLMSQLAPRHRRQVERGDAAGWRFRTLRREELLASLNGVKPIALFGMRRGESFASRLFNVPSMAGSGLDEASGATVFGAFDGDRLLAAALVGWANHRAYCLSGGCVPDGEECPESIWLHWRVIAALRDAGFHRYNLGGTSPAAVSPAHPANGMHRFKMGFSPRVVECCSVRWTLDHDFARVRHQTRWPDGAYAS
jgi:hypothetical protein